MAPEEGPADRPEKNDQQSSGDERGLSPPDAEHEREPRQELDPGHHEGERVDQPTRNQAIVVDHVRKGGRVQDLGDRRRHEDRAERDLNSDRQPRMSQPVREPTSQGFAPFELGSARFCQSGKPSL